MVRINRVYTRAGDDGTTALVGGQRVPKDSLRIDAYGTVDELNSVIGTVIASGAVEEIASALVPIQHELFNLGSVLALDPSDAERIPLPSVGASHVEKLEATMDEWNEGLPSLTSFVLPGGHIAAAQLHVARTVCRRAERVVLALSRDEEVPAEAVTYLNRLSDLLFVASRLQNNATGQSEVLWDSRAH
jgi:cob(I)alamin adenosyltransferase